jgi:hypothetical protein
MIKQQRDDKFDAEVLAAILESDDVPQEVCDYIADVIYELAGDVNLATPEVLRVAWPLIIAQYDYTDARMMQPLFIAIKAIPDDETRATIQGIMVAQSERHNSTWPPVRPECS